MKPDDEADLLDALDVADASLRVIYRQLADDPDRARDQEQALAELHARRRDLAQRLGLAVLARRRSATVAEAPSEPIARSAVANGATSTPYVAEAAPLEDEETPPSSTRASAAEVAAWTSTVASTGLGAGLNSTSSDATAWPLVLHELMAALGPPRSLTSALEIIDETEALDAVGTPDRQAQWARLPRNVQQAWLGALVARTRAVKDLVLSSDSIRANVKTIIARYPAWAGTHNPGHVHGLQVKHAPLHGTWLQDAKACWSALDELLGEELEVRSPGAAPRRKVKPVVSDEDCEPDIAAAWPLLPLVRGRKAVILGGDPREPNRERLERAFQFASLEWPSIEGPRKVEAAVERIRRGAYGVVLVLTPFVFHHQSTPIIEAAKDAGVPWAIVEGYGIATVRLGLERFLGGSHGDAHDVRRAR